MRASAAPGSFHPLRAAQPQPDRDAQLTFILDRLADLPAALRQTLADHLWSEIPLAISESVYAAAQAANVPLAVNAQTSGLELVESIVACVPSGATGLIQLGSTFLPVGQGITVIAPVKLPLGTSDTRTLTVTAQGPTALWLTGRQQPTFGVLAP